jgi:hypothetical protein
MARAACVKLAVDNTRRCRQVAVPQATIARFGRVDASLGPNWHVEADLGSNVVRLFQGTPSSAPPVAPDNKFARGLGNRALMAAMPRKLPPFLHREITRHKRPVWYFRRGKGVRIRMPGEFNSIEFLAAL